MLKDRYGNAVSTQSRAALAHLDSALELIRLYRGDPIAALDAALAEDPEFGLAWAMRAGLLAQQVDKIFAEEIEKSLRAGAACANGTEREHAHFAAARDWAAGRMHAGSVAYARIAQEHPRDLFAVQSAHVGCFFTGRASELRDWPVQALRAFTRDDDGYHALLGMAAFGYEECGDYARAESLGREAVSLEPRDAWAVHAVAHVHEMRGDTAAGMAWLRDGAAQWAPENAFAYHNWWHLALLHLDRGEIGEVLRLHDEKFRPATTGFALEWIDSAAMLWRLKLEGADVGDRWGVLADAWVRTLQDGHYAFNDCHALMAFLGAGRDADSEAILATMKRAAAREDDNGAMTRDVGLPVAEALVAFARGRFAECVEKLASVRGIAQRFGGSHAQRDILSLTALHAALRGGMKARAEAFAFERVSHKPLSPWARGLADRAVALRPARAAA